MKSTSASSFTSWLCSKAEVVAEAEQIAEVAEAVAEAEAIAEAEAVTEGKPKRSRKREKVAVA